MERSRLVAAVRPALAEGTTSYLALADALRGLVLDGRLLALDRLPPERALAADLGLSRTTVTAALDQLRGEGVLVSRQGSGTTVATRAQPVERPDEPTAAPGVADEIDLTVAAPTAPSLLAALAVRAAAELPPYLAGHGLHPLGLRPLRQAVAARFTARGLPTTPGQILVTQGALHGWDLLLRTFARPGDVVGLEVPTYAGGGDAVLAHAVRLLPIGVDAEGWSLPRQRTAPVLALVTADHQNPTGAHASDAQRRGLVRALPGTRIVVDETFAELDLDPDLARRRPLAAVDPAVVTVGSLSKLVWPGLRIGWVRASPDVVARLGSARGSQDLAAPVLDQLLATHVVGALDRIRDERIAVLRARCDHLHRLVTATGWTALRPSGGAVLWVDLGSGASSTRLAAAARRHGVRVTPGTRYGTGGTHDRFLRLPFVLPEPILTAAVERLRLAAADRRPASAPAPAWTA